MSGTDVSGTSAFGAGTSKIDATEIRKKVVTGENQVSKETMASKQDKDKNESCLHNSLPAATVDEKVIVALDKE